MPYTFELLVPQRLIYEKISGRYSVEDVANAVEELVKFLDTCKEGEGIILVDLSQLKSMDTNLMEFRKHTERYFRHPNYNITLGYGSSDKVVLNFLANALAGIFKQPIKLFAKEADALNYLMAEQPNLAESVSKALTKLREKAES
jgi:hypothetical protein